MTIQLDSVLTVVIGRNGQDGQPLSDEAWDAFRLATLTMITAYGPVVGSASGSGIGSDGANDGQDEDSAVFIALVDVNSLAALRRALAPILARFGQTTAAFAYDLEHEPVFSTTTDGFRPLEVVEVIDFLAEGRARRTNPQ